MGGYIQSIYIQNKWGIIYIPHLSCEPSLTSGIEVGIGVIHPQEEVPFSTCQGVALTPLGPKGQAPNTLDICHTGYLPHWLFATLAICYHGWTFHQCSYPMCSNNWRGSSTHLPSCYTCCDRAQTFATLAIARREGSQPCTPLVGGLCHQDCGRYYWLCSRNTGG